MQLYVTSLVSTLEAPEMGAYIVPRRFQCPQIESPHVSSPGPEFPNQALWGGLLWGWHCRNEQWVLSLTNKPIISYGEGGFVFRQKATQVSRQK